MMDLDAAPAHRPRAPRGRRSLGHRSRCRLADHLGCFRFLRFVLLRYLLLRLPAVGVAVHAELDLEAPLARGVGGSAGACEVSLQRVGLGHPALPRQYLVRRRRVFKMGFPGG